MARVAGPRKALSRRAALRRRSLQDFKQPPTFGPESDVASLIFTGTPAGAVKAGARFAPKGFSIVRKIYSPSGEFLEGLTRKIHRLRPVLEAGIKFARRTK